MGEESRERPHPAGPDDQGRADRVWILGSGGGGGVDGTCRTRPRPTGFTLTMTGAYRTFQGQKDLFEQRYTTTDTGRKSKVWNSTTYWLKPGMAMAAVPGTSNHGWGCAVDTALGGYGNAAQSVGEPIPVVGGRQRPRFGWSWEVQSEPWHLRLVSFSSADLPIGLRRHRHRRGRRRQSRRSRHSRC